MQADKDLSVFIDICHLIQAKGLVSGSGGNVSMRVGNEIVITPSGKSLEMIKLEDLVFLSKDGSFHCANGHVPSKEWQMHLNCYERADVNAVIHVHSTYAVAAACMADLDYACAIPVYTPGYAIRVGSLPVIPYIMPGSKELADAVANVIAKRNSVMMANHGVLAVGTGIESTLNVIEEIEDEVKLHFILNGRGNPLTKEQQKQLFSPNGYGK